MKTNHDKMAAGLNWQVDQRIKSCMRDISFEFSACILNNMSPFVTMSQVMSSM